MVRSISTRYVRATTAALLVTAASMVVADPVHAQVADSAEGRSHVVRRGDTLWDLARTYLNDPFLWPEIFTANRHRLQDPDLIQPDERLLIPSPYELRGGAPATEPGSPATRPAETEVRVRQAAARTRFYRGDERSTADPGEPTVLSDEAILTPAVEPGEFYSAPWLIDPETLPVLGRVIEDADLSEVRAAKRVTVHPRERVYLTYESPNRPRPGERLVIVRTGRRIKPWGRVVEPVAVVTVAAQSDEVMTVVVSSQFAAVEPGDRAVAAEEFPLVAGDRARPVPDGPTGELIAFPGEEPLYGLMDRAFLSIGRAQGLEVGDELIAFAPPRRVEVDGEPLLPDEPVARLRVVHVSDRTATVTIIRLLHPALRPGLPVRVVRKMP